MAGDKIHAVEYFGIEVAGSSVHDAGLFYNVTTPVPSITPPDWKAWNPQHKPENYSAAVQTSWQPVTISRGLDDNMEMYKWFDECTKTGATEANVKDVTITHYDTEDQPVSVWVLEKAFPTNYQASAGSAQSGEVMVESMTLTYKTARREQ
jgi:phage tail-like protein